MSLFLHKLNQDGRLAEALDDMKEYIYPDLPDHSINQARLDEWYSIMSTLPLKTDTDIIMSKLVNTFYDRFTYIPLSEFYTNIRAQLQFCLETAEEPLYIYFTNDFHKSYFWVLLLCFDILYDSPSIVGIANIDTEIPDGHALLYLDDAVYTGTQLLSSFMYLNRKTYLVCSFIGEVALENLQPYTELQLLVLPQQVPIAYSIISLNEWFALNVSEYGEYLDAAFCSSTCPSWYFQHKLADVVSLPVGIITIGLAIRPTNVEDQFDYLALGSLVNNCEEGGSCPKAFYKQPWYERALERSGIIDIFAKANANTLH